MFRECKCVLGCVRDVLGYVKVCLEGVLGCEREVRHGRNERGMVCVINRRVKVMEEEDVDERRLINVFKECR